MRRRLIVAAALGLTLVGVAGARSSNTADGPLRPRTLVSVPSRIGIASFAQDGDRIAWLEAATFECASLKPSKPLRIRNLLTGVQIALPSTQLPCDFGGPLAPSTLALAGQRALWAIMTQSHQETDGLFVSAAVNDPVERRACEFAVIGGSVDNYAPTLATAGDGRTLAFTMNGKSFFDKICTGLWLVDERGRARHITDKGPTLIAVGGPRIAVAQTIDYGGCVCTSSPAWSPDGTQIAFASRRDGRSEIYLVNADGTGERRIGLGDSPSWSADGTKLVFERQQGKQEAAKVVVINADGTGERILAAGSAPQWSPNASRIAFNEPDADGLLEVHVMNADGSGKRNLGHGAGQAWSPDGSRLAFGRQNAIYVINVDDTGLRKVASTPSDSSPLAWSPDGKRIAYTRFPGLGLVNADGGGEARLTTPKGFEDSKPVWSPDGRRIAFVRGTYNPVGEPVENTRVWVMNADGSSQKRLTHVNKDEHDPQWSPDGGRIAFARGELYLVSADGSGQTQLTTTRPTEARSSAELRSGRTGRLIAKAAAAGRVQAIALSQSTVALLVDGFFGRRIELFDARSTASHRTVSVPASTAPELSAAGANVVFHVRNAIYRLDGQRRTLRIVAVARSTPIGLSIEGRRVAWAENNRDRSRIRAINLPNR